VSFSLGDARRRGGLHQFPVAWNSIANIVPIIPLFAFSMTALRYYDYLSTSVLVPPSRVVQTEHRTYKSLPFPFRASCVCTNLEIYYTKHETFYCTYIELLESYKRSLSSIPSYKSALLHYNYTL
jgi:hypothetical protein